MISGVNHSGIFSGAVSFIRAVIIMGRVLPLLLIMALVGIPPASALAGQQSAPAIRIMHVDMAVGGILQIDVATSGVSVQGGDPATP